MQLSYLLLLVQYVAAYPPLQPNKRAGWTGIATFNNFASQSSTVCNKRSGRGGAYAAAVADLSPNIWKGAPCSGTKDTSQCAGQSPVAGYHPPSCPPTNCGKCFTVTNVGGIGGGRAGGTGKSIVVEIVDACPATNAANYCKTDIPADQRCEAGGTDMLDIDQSAYQALTGRPFGGGANLNVQITESPNCQVGSTGSVGASGEGASDTPSGGGSDVPSEGGTSTTKLTPTPVSSSRAGGSRVPTSRPSVRPSALSSGNMRPGASGARGTCRNRKNKKNKRSKSKKAKKEAARQAPEMVFNGADTQV